MRGPGGSDDQDEGDAVPDHAVGAVGAVGGWAERTETGSRSRSASSIPGSYGADPRELPRFEKPELCDGPSTGSVGE